MKLLEGLSRKRSQTQKRQMLYDSIYTRYLEKSNSLTENRMVVVKGWKKGEMGSYYSLGTEFQFRKMKSSRDSDDCTVM